MWLSNSPLEIFRSVGRLVALWKDTDLAFLWGRWASRWACWPPPFTWPSAMGACHGSLARLRRPGRDCPPLDPYSGAAPLRRRRQHHLALLAGPIDPPQQPNGLNPTDTHTRQIQISALRSFWAVVKNFSPIYAQKKIIKMLLIVFVLKLFKVEIFV